MLRITTYRAEDECLLKLEGCLAGPWVPELARYWRQIAAEPDVRHVRIELTDVCHVDDAGRELMTTMYRAGVHFLATGFVMPELVREISETVEHAQRS